MIKNERVKQYGMNFLSLLLTVVMLFSCVPGGLIPMLVSAQAVAADVEVVDGRYFANGNSVSVESIDGAAYIVCDGNTIECPTGTVIYGGGNGIDCSSSDISISAGSELVVYAGGYNGSITGEAKINITGGQIDKICLSQGTATLGGAELKISGGRISKLYIGSETQAVEVGDVKVTVSGGYVESLIANVTDNSKITADVQPSCIGSTTGIDGVKETVAPSLSITSGNEVWCDSTTVIKGQISDWPSINGVTLYYKKGIGEAVARQFNEDGSFSLEVSEAGKYTFYAVDKSGNKSTESVVTLKVDSDAPALSLKEGASEVWVNSNVSVTVKADDKSGSGIFSITAKNVETGKLFSGVNTDGNVYTFTFDEEGKNSYGIYAYDNVNNRSELPEEITVRIDRTKPVVKKVYARSSDENDISIVGTVTDKLSGLKEVYIKKSGETDYTKVTLNEAKDGFVYALGVKSYEDSLGLYDIKCIDEAGNEIEISYEIKVDSVKPVISLLSSDGYTDGRWNGEAVSITGNATDDLSGIAAVEYKLGDSEEWTQADFDLENNSFRIKISEEFSGKCHVRCKDNAGLISEEKSITVKIDKTVPKITVYGGGDAWVNGGVELNGVVTDAKSGVETVYVALGSSEKQAIEFTEDGEFTFTVSAREFAGECSFYCVDKAGNKSATKVKTVKMDNIAPVVNPDIFVSPSKDVVGELTLSGAVTDKTSGIKAVYWCRLNDGVEGVYTKADFEADGYSFTVNEDQYNTYYKVYCIDNAGNISDKVAVKVAVDEVSPVVESVVPSTKKLSKSVTLTVNASDNNSGVAMVYYKLKGTDDFAKASYSYGEGWSFIADEGNGEKTYTVYCEDRAGNISEEKDVTVALDNTAPVVEITEIPEKALNSELIIKGSTADKVSGGVSSGVTKIGWYLVCEIDGKDVTVTDESYVEPDEDGNYTITISKRDFGGVCKVFAIDAAGNRSAEAEGYIIIDATAPVVSDATVSTVNWTGDSVKITCDAEDIKKYGDPSGVETVYCEKATADGDINSRIVAEYENGKYIMTIAAQNYKGDYRIYAVDCAGNISDSVSITVQMDDVPPELSVSADREGWGSSGVTVSGTVIDLDANGADSSANSCGVDKVYYYKVGSDEITDIDFNNNGKFSVVIDDANQDAKYAFYAVDKVGNRCAEVEIEVKTDSVNPVVTATPSTSDWTQGDVWVNVTAVDGEADGVKSDICKVYYYKGDDSAEKTEIVADDNGGYGFTITSQSYEGEYTVYAVDNAGNISDEVTFGVRMDNCAPELVSDTLVASPSEWTNKDVIISGVVSDDLSGISKIKLNRADKWRSFNVDMEEDFDAETGRFSITIPADDYEGDYTVTVTDNAGKVSVESDIGVKMDKTKPVIHEVSKDVEDGAWASEVTVTIKATDNLSTISRVVYSSNEDALKDSDSSAVLGDDGNYYFTIAGSNFNSFYYVAAFDVAGNMSDVSGIQLNLDISNPEFGDDITVSPDSWTNKTVEISGTVSDPGEDEQAATAGVDKIYYFKVGELDKSSVTADDIISGNKVAEYDSENNSFSFIVGNEENYDGAYAFVAVDKAKNVSDIKFADVKIDVTLPVIEDDLVVKESTWTNKDVIVTAIAADDASGVAALYYLKNENKGLSAEDVIKENQKAIFNEEKQNYEIKLDAQTYEGEYALVCVDNAGNISLLTGVKVMMDNTVPVVDSIDVSHSDWTNGKVVLTVSASDEISGVTKVYCYKDGTKEDERFVGDNEATLSEDGTYSFVIEKQDYCGDYIVQCFDRAENVSEEHKVAVKMDTTDPGVVEAKASEKWTNGTVEVTCTVKDNEVDGIEMSNIESAICKPEGKSGKNAELKEFSENEDGTWSIKFEIPAQDYTGKYAIVCYDKAGNNSEKAVVALNMDVTAPVVESVDAYPSWETNGEVTISGTVYDVKVGAAEHSDIKDITCVPTDSNGAADIESKRSIIKNEDGTWSYEFKIPTQNYTGSYKISCIDEAGNSSEIKTVSVKMDIAIPVVNEVKASQDWTNGKVKITGTVMDTAVEGAEMSDIVDVTCVPSKAHGAAATDGKFWKNDSGTWSFSFIIPAQNYTDEYIIKCVDKAGNKSEDTEKSSIAVNMDVSRPEVIETKAYQNWTNGEVTITGKVRDVVVENVQMSDILDIECTAAGNGKEYIAESKSVSKNDDGTYSYEFTIPGQNYNGKYEITCLDKAGNSSKNTEESSVKVYMDIQEPLVDSVKASITDWTNDTVKITVNVSDISVNGAMSGVAKITCVPTGSDEAFAPNAYIVSETEKKSCEYVFMIPAQNYHGDYTVTCYDQAGNSSSTKSVTVKMDTEKPVVESVNVEASTWTNGKITVSGVVVDATEKGAMSGIAEVYCKPENASASYVPTRIVVTEKAVGRYEYSFTIDEQNYFDRQYTVYCVDHAGNTSEEMSKYVYMDTENPVLEIDAYDDTADRVVDENGNDVTEFDKTTNNITRYYKDGSAELSFKISDNSFVIDDPKANNGENIIVKPAFSSGVPSVADLVEDGFTVKVTKINEYDESAEVVYNSENNIFSDNVQLSFSERMADENGYYYIGTLVISGDGDYTVSVDYSDKASNSSSNITYEEITIDTVDPVISSSYTTENAHKVHAQRAYFDDTQIFDIIIDEHNFRASDIEVSVIAVDAQGNEVKFADADGAEITATEYYRAYLKDASNWVACETDKNVYSARLTFAENANYALSVTYTDLSTRSGALDTLEFTVDTVLPEAEITVGDWKWDKLFEALTFGHWTNKSTEVSISYDDITSPLEPVAYYLYEGEKALTYNDLAAIDESSWTPYSKAFKVSPNKQFVAYVRVVDYAGNLLYISSNGIIVDNVKPVIEKIAPEVTISFPSAKNIYNGNVDVFVSVDDPIIGDVYSGLEYVSYEIIKDGSTVTQTGYLYRRNAEEPTKEQLRQSIAENLTVIAKKNNSNDVEIKITAKDNAGNTTTKSEKIKIDITAPTIKITYDNNDGVDSYSESTYFDANRTATVVITERNFDAARVEMTIESVHGSKPSISSWTTRGIGDATTHTAKIKYSADDDYTFAIAFTDDADNVAKSIDYEGLAPKKFTVDKTAPVVNYYYDNNDVRNGMYYNSDRTMTVVVTEHNFDPSEFVPTTTGSGMSSWKNEGDVHTATISFTEDAEYSFNYSLIDKAGNAAQTVLTDSFIIDTVKPTIRIVDNIKGSEATEKSSYNGDVSFDVIYGDKYADTNKIKVDISETRGNDVSFSGVSETYSSGGEFVRTLRDSDKLPDGIYKIVIEIYDLAGNSNSVTKEFSINRKSSIFTFSEELLSLINGKFTKYVENDFTISEVNCDKITETKITCLLNGVVTVLEKDKDYTVVTQTTAGGWVENIYTLSSSFFSKNGMYEIVVESKDNAGNTVNNVDNRIENKQASFYTDNVEPIVGFSGVEDGDSIDSASHEFDITYVENIYIDTIRVDVYGSKRKDNLISSTTYSSDGKDESAKLNSDSGDFKFSVDESENGRIYIEVMAVDKAGNESEVASREFTLSTNAFIRFINNTAAVVVTCVLLAALLIIIIILIIRKRNR